MKRREFMKNSALAVGACCLFPSFIIQSAYSKEELMGRGNPLFFGDHYKLRKDASVAFDQMRAAALKEGIDMYSASSYRSYAHQNRIWSGKYNRYTGQGLDALAAIRKIIRYSTIPGTSRHHWGTDLDIIDVSKPTPADALLASNYQPGGVYEELGAWLSKHANAFGFFETYTNDPARKGFEYEPWHYSYAPLSKPMLQAFLDIDLKKELLNCGLLGAAHFTPAFVEQYVEENVKSIHPFLK